MGRCFAMGGLQGHVFCGLQVAGVHGRSHILSCAKKYGSAPAPVANKQYIHVYIKIKD